MSAESPRFTPEAIKILRKEEVLCVIPNGEQATVERERSDNRGLYLLEVWSVDEKGEKCLYTYCRKGAFKENKSLETRIDIMYEDGYAKTFRIFDEKTGVWK